MRNNLFRMLFLTAAVMVSTFAQSQGGRPDNYNQLILSEVRLTYGNHAYKYGYLELYNASDKTIQLSDYFLQSSWVNLESGPMQEGTMKLVLPGELEPGKTWLFGHINPMTVEDEYGDLIYTDGFINQYVKEKCDYLVRGSESAEGVFGTQLLTVNAGVALFYRGDTSHVEGTLARDSVMVDRFWIDNVHSIRDQYPIAGVVSDDPPKEFVYVRKTNVNRGNPNFDQSRGTNADDSEWQPLPRNISFNELEKNRYVRFMNPEKMLAYTTIGQHENQTQLEVTPKHAGITIDKDNMKITVPYGIRRDSVFHNFNIGPNHAWDLQLNGDTSQYYLSTGDTIIFYTLGDKMETYRFHVQVEDVPANFVNARPLWYKPYNVDDPEVWYIRYTISDGLAQDTIGMIPFSEPVDTLLKYLAIEKSASAVIEFVDNEPRPELKNGDVLKITSGGATKSYRLSVRDFAPNHEDKVASVYMPGMLLWENKYFEYTDTFIYFKSTVYDYNVTLPSDTETPPAIIASPANSRATVTVKRPVSLEGSDADRTAVITCVAEDDTSIKTYRITFNVEREEPPFTGEPFFCDFGFSWNTWTDCWNIEVYNPSTEDPIAFSDYMLVKLETGDFSQFIEYGSTGGASAFGDRSNKRANQYVYRPGYWVNADAEEDVYWTLDPVFTESEILPKEVFSIQSIRGYPVSRMNHKDANGDIMATHVDVVTGNRGPSNQVWTAGWVNSLNKTYWPERLGYNWEEALKDPSLYPYGEDMFVWNFSDSRQHAKSGDSFILYKIKDSESGDSIKDGLKPIDKDWLNDYEVVDMVNGPSLTTTPWTVYDKVNGVDSAFRFSKTGSGFADPNFARKPWVYKGNPVDGASFGDATREGEWEVFGILPDGSKTDKTVEGVTKGAVEYGESRFNYHHMVTYSHIPYITSPVYLIGKGLDGVQPILGVLPFTTVDVFMGSIVKPDPDMSVIVMDANDVVKTGGERINTGDKVKTTSANGKSSVNYAISVGLLSKDVSLSAKDGSGISVSDTSVIDIPFGKSIAWVLDNVEAHSTAKPLIVVDMHDEIVPMEKYNADTMTHEERLKSPVYASENYRIEVTAQNGNTKQLYSLKFAESNELRVYSDVYVVVEEYKTINFVYGTSVENFLRNLVAPTGSEMYVTNKMGQRRDIGSIRFDDRLILTKDGKTINYRIKFSADERYGVQVKETLNDSEAFAYPNPTQGAVSIKQLSGADKLVVRNITGQVVNTMNVNAEQMQIELAGAAGVYFVSVENQGKLIRTIKVVKE